MEIYRFIDHIFAIWKHGQDSLDLFLQQINLLHPTIKFTAETSMDGVNFLDTTVILEGGTLHMTCTPNQWTTHQYLSPNSCPPKCCTATIPCNQGLRPRRICSRREDFEKRANDLKDYLLARCYEPSSVDHQIQRAA